MNKSVIGVLLGVSLLSAACGTSEYDWQRARALNTLASYQAFLKQHPQSDEADTARGFILALQDDQAWKAALLDPSRHGYEGYLSAYPGGVHAQQAKFAITAAERASAWQTVKRNSTYSTLRAFLRAYPDGPEANLARDRLSEAAAQSACAAAVRVRQRCQVHAANVSGNSS